MTDEELRGALLRLADEHRGDRDGGYALVRDVLAALREAGEPARRVLREWVDREDEPWGIALEALVQEGAPETAPWLEARLRAGGRRLEWRDQVILALMRMRHAPALDLYVAHVEAGVRDRRPPALSLLQHLYVFDAERALSLSSRYFGEHLPAEADQLGGVAQGALRTLAGLDSSLVPELVRRTTSISPPAGACLARMMSGYLDMPWLRDELGPSAATRLKQSL